MTKVDPLPRIEEVSKVWKPDAKLYLPEREIVIAPAFGPGKYSVIGRQILGRGLVFPTGDDTAPLLYTAYCVPELHDNPRLEKVKKIMRNRWLLVGNRILWTDKGKYVLQDQKAIGISQPLDVNQLEKILEGGRELSWGGIRFSADGRVRFAPKESYRLGEHTSESLAKDGGVIVEYSVPGAEQLGEVSTKFPNKPRTWGVEVSEGQDPEQRLSGVDDFYGVLNVGGDWGDVDDGYAFGVCEGNKVA
ncbi:hypothetical protein ACFL0X_02400 [Nanoarchaeota archaeon]